jgi:hypothetical protein
VDSQGERDSRFQPRLSRSGGDTCNNSYAGFYVYDRAVSFEEVQVMLGTFNANMVNRGEIRSVIGAATSLAQPLRVGLIASTSPGR